MSAQQPRRAARLAALAAGAMLAASFLPAKAPLDVVYFAGLGGTSGGYEEGIGKHPDVALNHKDVAIGVHMTNFPDTEHLIADVFDVDPRVVRPGEKWRSFWVSPDCRHHSPAKGGKPLDTGVRGLAWIVIKVCKLLGDNAPDVVFLENVCEWRNWGPLFRAGMIVDGQPLAEDDKRVGRPIPWLKGTIYDLFNRRMAQMGYVADERDLVGADYGDPTTRKRLFRVWRRDGMPVRFAEPTHAPRHLADGRGLLPWLGAHTCLDFTVDIPSIFGRKTPLKDRTECRIAKGIKRHVVGAGDDAFIVTVTHTKGGNGSSHMVPTITTAKGGELAVAAPTLLRTDYVNTRAGCVHDLREPAKTATTQEAFAVTAPTLVPLTHDGDDGRSSSVRPPFVTVTGANRGEIALATAFLGRQFGTNISGRDLKDPHPTVMVDGAGGKSQVIASVIDKYYGSGVAQVADRPLDAVTSKDRFSISAAYLEQANGDSIGRPLPEPVSTILQAGCHQRLVSVGLVPANDNDGSSRRAQVVAFLWKHLGEPTEAEWADPLGTLDARAKFGLVILHGQVWQIVDIGMRMLQPRELARAMGFPDSFVTNISAFHGKITKTQEVALIGNSVCRKTVAALIRENLGPGRWIPHEERVPNAVRMAA